MRRARGFTLIEVMFALALLGFALVILVRSTAHTIASAEGAHMLGIATDLARAKMYDIEEKEIKEGFTDSDQSQLDWKGFEEEGWPQIQYRYKIEHVEMPAFDDLAALTKGHAAATGFGSAFGSGCQKPNYGSGGSAFGSAFGSNGAVDPLQSFQNSMLGSMLGQFGVGAGGKSVDVLGAQGGALFQMQYTLFQQILKVTIVKVTLEVKWTAFGTPRDLKVVEFLTDPSQMDRVLQGMGATDLPDNSGSAGSGSNRTGSAGSAIRGPGR